jgi:hypothetical protein
VPWEDYRGQHINTHLFDRVDEALAVLEEGLSL